MGNEGMGSEGWRKAHHFYYSWMEGGKRQDLVLEFPVISLPQMCGKLDPTFASATLLFQKDPPANVQLFQVSTHSVSNNRAPQPHAMTPG